MELDFVQEKVLANIKAMDIEGQEIVVLYMVLTKILESLRSQSYLNYGLAQITKIYNQNFKQEDIQWKNKDIRKKLQKLSEKGDGNLSLLYNLCFIRLLAESFKDKAVSINSKRQVTKKINTIIQQLVLFQ